MGNQCSDCIQPPGEPILPFPVYQKILHSYEVANSQLPDDLIPQTVKQKIKLLNIHHSINETKQLWCYNQGQNTVAYIIADKVQEQHLSSQAKKEKQLFKPKNDESVIIYIFKQNQETISDHISNKFKQFQDSEPQHQRKDKQRQRIKKLLLQKVYCGQLNPQMKVQNAVIIMENGQNYQGSVKDNFVLDGQHGIMKNAIGTHTYQGQWKDGKPHGQGQQTLSDKLYYKGKFEKGKWQGKGQLTLTNDRNKYQFKGIYENGSLQGTAQMYLNDKLVYEGNFKNGKQHGNGRWQSSKGQSYEGQFIQGQKSGKGTYYFTPEIKYIGNFKNGKPNGEGQLIQGNKCTKGQWYNGQNILVYTQNPQ